MDFFTEWLADLGIESEVTVMESNRLTNVILDGEYDVFHWGWYVEPDPASILDVTCDQRASWNDSWYCDEEYDALRGSRAGEMDDDERVEQVQQMQKMLFEDSPYLVLAYTTDGQAFRSDRFACFVPQPKPDGVLVMQYGAHNYSLLRPAEEAGDCDGVPSAIGADGVGRRRPVVTTTAARTRADRRRRRAWCCSAAGAACGRCVGGRPRASASELTVAARP